MTQNNKKVWSVKRALINLGVSFIIFCIGAWLGVTYFGKYTQPTNVSVREKDNQYKFISPLLFTDNLSPDTKDRKSLDDNLNSFIKDSISNNKVSQVSVYFRDLNTGRWLGINENEQYEPASLLKIAVLIAYLRIAEINPDILEKSLRASNDSHNFDISQNYKPKNPVEIGKAYTIRSLLSSMIVGSDNNAMVLLTQNIATSSIDTIYKDLQIPMNDGAVSNISPALYSRFFRILYNSSYLSHPASESVLGLLSQTDFTSGLIAGLPVGTVVSHKFGERTADSITPNSEKELHDCGIVYYPDHPYFICVMTKGKDFNSLEKVISSISKIVWNDVDREN